MSKDSVKGADKRSTYTDGTLALDPVHVLYTGRNRRCRI